MGMVLRTATEQVTIGLCIGMVVAVFCGRLLQSQLHEVGKFDLTVLGGAILVLTLCALIAAIVPALRAASVDPNQALRPE
jgi:macrolide transport system ATP-binding/permease protein